MSEITREELIEWQKREEEWHKRVETLESFSNEVRQFTAETHELNKRYDSELREHENRIDNIEKRPANNWFTLVSAALGTIGGTAGGAILTMIAQSLK